MALLKPLSSSTLKSQTVAIVIIDIFYFGAILTCLRIENFLSQTANKNLKEVNAMLVALEIGKRKKLWNEHDKARKEHDEMSDQFQKIWLEYMKRRYKYRALFIILSKGKVNESDLKRLCRRTPLC